MQRCLTCKKPFTDLQKHWFYHPECRGLIESETALVLTPEPTPLQLVAAGPTAAARSVFSEDLKRKVSYDLASMHFNSFMPEADIARFKLACTYWCNMIKQQIYADLLPVFDSINDVERLDLALDPLANVFAGLQTPAKVRSYLIMPAEVSNLAPPRRN